MHYVNLDAALASLDESALASVRASLHSTAVGDSQDLVTPLVPDGDPDTQRSKIINSLLPRVLSDYPWLNEAEEAQATKIGSWSIKLPYREREGNVLSYFAVNAGVPDVDTLRKAVEIVSRRMPTRLQLSSIPDVVQKMPKGTNLGWPYFTSNERYIPHVASLAERVQRSGFTDGPDACLLFWRGQPRGLGEVTKNRSVWGYPHYITVLELQAQIPLLHHLRGQVQYASWNNSDVVNAAMTLAFSHSNKLKYSVDFSSYDQTLHPLLIDAVEAIMIRCFDRSASSQIEYIFRGIRQIPLLTPKGMIVGDHGMPSGSGVTNMVDSLCQDVGWEYMGLMLGVKVLFRTFQGDDAVVVFDRPVDPELLAKLWLDHFGMKFSSEKGNTSNDTIHFCQNVYNGEYVKGGVNVYIRPIMRALNGMLSYERLVRKSEGWSGYMDTIRWVQQCENTKWHPRFYELVSWLWNQDKYAKLPASTWLEEVGGTQHVERVLKQRSENPYGKEPLSRLERFETVKLYNKFNGTRTSGLVAEM